MLKKTSEYQNSLAVQKNEGTLQDKLVCIHEVITTTFPFVDRITLAIYEHETDLLKIFMASCYSDKPLSYHGLVLHDLPLLMDIMHKGKACVTREADLFLKDKNVPILQMADFRYASSYIVPVYKDSIFVGFIIFNSGQADAFADDTLHQMDLFGHMVSLMVMNELMTVYAVNDAQKKPAPCL